MKRRAIATIAAAILALAMTACGNAADAPMVDESAIETTETEATVDIKLAAKEDGGAGYGDEVDATEESVEESIEESMEEATEAAEEATEEVVEDTNETAAAAVATTKTATTATAAAMEEGTLVASAGDDDESAMWSVMIEGSQLDGLVDSLAAATGSEDDGYSMELVEGTPISELIASAGNDGSDAPHNTVGDWLKAQENAGTSTGNNGQAAQVTAQNTQQNTQNSQDAQAVLAAQAAAANGTCSHDWQKYEKVVDTYEELQDVEVWGLQCIVCGLKEEGAVAALSNNHTATCMEEVWDDLAGCWAYNSGSRPYSETVQRMVTVNIIKAGWKCSICGAEQ